MHITRKEYVENKIVKHHEHKCLHDGGVNCICNDLVINVTTQKYLGLTFDYKLNWDKHFSELNKKLRKLTFLFKITQNILSLKVKKTLYYSLVQSIITYGIRAYGAENETRWENLEKLQKTILKTMMTNKQIKKQDNIYKTTNLLPFRKLYFYNMAVNYIHDKTYTRIANTNYSLRSQRKHLTPTTFNRYGERTKLSQIPKILNEIPAAIKSIIKIGDFKKALIDFLLS